MIYRKATVTNILSSSDQVLYLGVKVLASYIENNEIIISKNQQINAIAYYSVMDKVNIGDTLIVELSPIVKKLGTGGYAFAITNLDREQSDTIANGHIVKARYCPLQHIVTSLDEQGSACHEIIKNKSSIDNMSVIVADLHSALPAILAGIKAKKPEAKIVYIMPDGASLPIGLSKNVSVLKEKSWIYKTITCGQAYGGDGETINIYNALLAAKYVYGADVTVVAQGPGNAGTGTTFGFSGMQCADILNAVGVLQGKPIATLRMSNADIRHRHYGISHHCLTAISKATFTPVIIPLPLFDDNTECEQKLPADFTATCKNKLNTALKNSNTQHKVVEISTKNAYEALCKVPLKLSTMGRGLEDDYSSFVAAYVSGVVALTE